MKKEKRGLHITINLTNRWLYTLITIGILAIVGVGVYAYTGASGVGHDLSEIEPCTAGKILQTNTGGNGWDCVNMPSGGSISTDPLYVEGAITAPEGTLRDDGGGWLRTYGNTGWYSETYGGGWYMTDANWLRAYNDKGIYTAGNVQAGGTVTAGKLDFGVEIIHRYETDGAAWAVCPAGKSVLGGGCNCFGRQIEMSIPNQEGMYGHNAWYCDCYGSSNVRTYAICASVNNIWSSSS